VTVNDGNKTTTGPTWSFTTGSQPPTALVVHPNGGETLNIGEPDTLRWDATDDIGVVSVDLYLSRTGLEGSYETIATGLANTGSYAWTVTGPASVDAFLKVVAYDAQGNSGEDVSDAAFTIFDPATRWPSSRSRCSRGIRSAVRRSSASPFRASRASASPCTT
jgi:hypothetical protein